MLLDDAVRSDPLHRRLRRLTRGERIEEAEAFIRSYFHENELPATDREQRLKEVRRELSRLGFYRHTPEELAFGARVAWRNHANCVGRLFWKSLDVLDCRSLAHPDEIAAQCFEHMRKARAVGGIRSIISIFAPVETATPAYVENAQIAQYAGYLVDGGTLGDPQNVEFTRIVQGLGWASPQRRSAFDLLPLLIRDERGRRHLYELPEGLVQEVEIRAGGKPRFDALGLRWYSVPCVADMILTIGGIDYPCAPFNGHYMATEIASRDLVDEFRYDLLEPIADALDVDRGDMLWKDRALTELNAAVLRSFRAAGSTIIDHHAASAQFVEFVQKERACGRIPSANWSWIVPPQAGAACPTFHMPMEDMHDVPNFYRSRATDGGPLRLSRATEIRTRFEQRKERIVRRVRDRLRRVR